MYKDFEETNKIYCWQGDGDILEYKPYHVNHMIAGDTDSGYFTIPDKIVEECDGLDDIVNLADTVGDIANESFPDFCKKAFNCPESRLHTVKTAREVVSDKSFFLTKKRYIMHVVDDEGKRVDKLKIMGVEIKKSDTSIAIKELLMRLVNLILDGYEREHVVKEIKKMKRDFTKFNLKELASPLGCKTLKKLQDQYAATGNLKGGHYSARAAIFYNSLCGPTDKRVNPGEKIGLVYIRHPKSKYIGFPFDINTLPSWVDELQIDYDREWEAAQKKLTNYISALEWDTKSMKTAKKKELFGF